MSRIYFVSDLHIRDIQEQKAQTFLRFLLFIKQQPQPVTLILGGDIFDLWLDSHKYFRDKFAPLIDSIRDLIQNQHTVYYFEGNHDLHLKEYWEEQLGAKVYSGPEYFLFDKTIVRFEHGDQMNPEDHGYHFLRWFLRTPVLTFLIKNLPSGLVAYIGERASGMSRHYTDGLRDEGRIKQMIHQHALRAFDERAFDVFVHGHVHLQDEYIFERQQKMVASINLGSWDKSCRVLKLEHGVWNWESWDLI